MTAEIEKVATLCALLVAIAPVGTGSGAALAVVDVLVELVYLIVVVSMALARLAQRRASRPGGSRH